MRYKGKAYGALGNTSAARQANAQWGLAEMRKASQLPDSPVPANHAGSPELEPYANQGQFGSLGLRVYKCADQVGQIGNPA
jgi:hypothetical protein